MLSTGISKKPWICCAAAHVCHQLGGYRDTCRTHPTILSSIAIIRNYSSYTVRRGTTHGVDHDQQIHQVVIGGGTYRLDQKDITTAHIFLNFKRRLTVAETTE